MNAVVMEQFFAPMSTDLVDSLIAEYRLQRQKIDQVRAAFVDHGLGSVMQHFMRGNMHERDVHLIPTTDKMFGAAGAIKSLDAAYWDKALRMTDVLDLMPKARRDEWFESIRTMKTPEFADESVRATLADLLASRAKFFAERVDGIFRGLSCEHVTNRPEGFSKRMILRHVVRDYGLSGSDEGHIHDLRCVIAKFMGRDEPPYNATAKVISATRRQSGEWFELDGGAIKLRTYLKGTGHLEVHPDMAWRLNAMLASLYPAAIPASFREPPKRKPKDIAPIQKPLPFAVIGMLAGMKDGFRTEKNTGDNWRQQLKHIQVRNSVMFDYGDHDKHVKAQAEHVLASIGAVKDGDLFRFDYPPRPVLDLIITSGCIPDQKSHQFYPTPEGLARKAVELAELDDLHLCLEPSAGTGGLLQFMPAGTVAVEASTLHCEVLRNRFKAVEVHEADFLKWAPKPKLVCRRFDRIVMNPPFDRGQWRAHLEHAAGLLDAGGRLVAILPEGARNAADLLPGMTLEWHGPLHNQFAGTSVSVMILTAIHKQRHA